MQIGSRPGVSLTTTTATTPTTTAPTRAEGTVVVQKGDTLSGIAAQHGVKLSDLIAANPQIENPDLIFPDQVVNLPGGSTPAVTPKATPSTKPTAQAKDAFAGGGIVGGLGGRKLPNLSEMPGFAALPASTRAEMERLGEKSPAFKGEMLQLTTNTQFSALPAAMQQKVLGVMEATTPQGHRAMNALLERTVNGQPALLAKDKGGVTLLDNLDTLRTAPLHPDLARTGSPRGELMAQLINDAAHPGTIRQDSKGTCTVTSMQHRLAQQDPSEYVRIQTGLLSPAGGVTLRGGFLTRADNSIRPDSAKDRSTTSRLFQAAMMEYGNGQLMTYDNISDRHAVGQQGVGRGGLREAEEIRALNGLFGGNHRKLDNTRLDQLKNLPEGTFMAFKWSNNGAAGHAVNLVKVAGDRVYFRNPWGPRADRAGTTYDPPPRRMEDPRNGVESMSLADAKKYFRFALH